MPPAKHLTGRRFGRLTVLREQGRNRHGSVMWATRCDCGTELAVSTGSLTDGNTTSCGCSRTKHGATWTPEWSIWQTMIKRCGNPGAKGYQDYGGRGIRVCESWRKDFRAFIRDVGPRPSPRHSLDRLDTDGNYEPGNVRWATPIEQARNKRNNRVITIGGTRRTLAEWSEVSGIRYTTIRERLRRGWSASRAVTEPTKPSSTRGPACS